MNPSYEIHPIASEELKVVLTVECLNFFSELMLIKSYDFREF